MTNTYRPTSFACGSCFQHLAFELKDNPPQASYVHAETLEFECVGGLTDAHSTDLIPAREVAQRSSCREVRKRPKPVQIYRQWATIDPAAPDDPVTWRNEAEARAYAAKRLEMGRPAERVVFRDITVWQDAPDA